MLEILPAAQTGFVQLIPGRGQTVAGTVCDAIIGHVYRKERPWLTTHPLSAQQQVFSGIHETQRLRVCGEFTWWTRSTMPR